jgi:hypothetical protein
VPTLPSGSRITAYQLGAVQSTVTNAGSSGIHRTHAQPQRKPTRVMATAEAAA